MSASIIGMSTLHINQDQLYPFFFPPKKNMFNQRPIIWAFNEKSSNIYNIIKIYILSNNENISFNICAGRCLLYPYINLYMQIIL